MSHAVGSNFQPLHFHQVHGENIRLMNDRAVACRHEGFCNSLAFSDRPVKICEPVYIRFVDVSTHWSGALRIGFTMHDPTALKSELPLYACPDLAAMRGNWAKALADRLVKKDSILYYYVDHIGNVHYGIDSEHHGILFGGVNTFGKLWAVLDIYGSTVSVEFVNPFSLNEESVVVTSDVNDLAVLSQSYTQSASAVIMPLVAKLNCNILFHAVHGENVTLNSFRNVGSMKMEASKKSYIFTERSIKLGEKVVVQVLSTNLISINCNSFIYGFTSCNPSTLVPAFLPEDPEDLVDREEYWVIEDDTHCYCRGDFIVYCINSEGEVKVSKNDVCETAIFYVDSTQPLWLFFNVSGNISELQIMGSLVSDEIDQITSKLEGMRIILPDDASSNKVPGTSGQQGHTECVICYEKFANCALYRCGHMCLCYECALKIWKSESNVQCPLCREPIKDVIKIYR